MGLGICPTAELLNYLHKQWCRTEVCAELGSITDETKYLHVDSICEAVLKLWYLRLLFEHKIDIQLLVLGKTSLSFSVDCILGKGDYVKNTFNDHKYI